MVCVSVCLSFMFVSLAETAELNEMPFTGDLGGNRVLDGVKITPRKRQLSGPLKALLHMLQQNKSITVST